MTSLQEASWTNPWEGLEIAEAKSTVSQSEDSTAWTECLDDTSGAMYYYNSVTVKRFDLQNRFLSTLEGMSGRVIREPV